MAQYEVNILSPQQQVSYGGELRALQTLMTKTPERKKCEISSCLRFQSDEN